MQQKAQLDSAAAESSCRGPSQVLACSIVGLIIQLVHVVYCGEEQSIGKLPLFCCTFALINLTVRIFDRNIMFNSPLFPDDINIETTRLCYTPICIFIGFCSDSSSRY